MLAQACTGLSHEHTTGVGLQGQQVKGAKYSQEAFINHSVNYLVDLCVHTQTDIHMCTYTYILHA